MVIVVTAYKGHVGPLQAGRQGGQILWVCVERGSLGGTGLLLTRSDSRLKRLADLQRRVLHTL